jgi:outer membrane protein OmpA-like peptidoglycan-associated protein
MENLSYRLGRIGGTAGAVVLLAGCGLTSVGAQAGGQATGSEVTITQTAIPSALIAVTAGSASGLALSGLVAATARPSEDIRILKAGTPAKTIVASNSPGPTRKVIPGPPRAPGRGQTAYQSAQYTKKLTTWRVERAAAVQAEAAETSEKVSAWLSGLELPQRISRLADPPGDEGGLAAESAVAASAMADLQAEAGNIFGNHRVIVLFASDLSGALPAGELTGDDVIVATSDLQTAAGASAAQAELLGAGAAQAAVVGPEVTAAQFNALVSADLSQGAGTDTVSTPVLFGNGSAALDATAVSQLSQLLARLQEAPMTVIINGYASISGTAQANYFLSYQRATNVASFFESHGVPEDSLIIVGHGATDAFGSGSPVANRRVLVVIEQSAGIS